MRGPQFPHTTAQPPPDGIEVHQDVPLARHTYLRLGGPARYFAIPEDVAQRVLGARSAPAGSAPFRWTAIHAGPARRSLVTKRWRRTPTGRFVRYLIGVVRYEGDEARDLENFFMAGARLVNKKRTEPTVTRRYDESRTPYRRLREDACLEQNIERSMEKRS